MRRLSVSGIVRAAFSFTLNNLGAIIGVICLPMAAVTAAGFFAEQRFYAAMEGAYAAHGMPDGAAVLLFLAYVVLAMLLYAMMMVGVARLAQGKAPAGRFPLAFGIAEWRLFRAWFGLALFLMVPLLVFAMAATAMIPGDMSAVSAPQLGRMYLILPLLAAAMVFIGLRFAFLLPGLAAGEGGTEKLLARAWAMSAGNFWRFFAIMLLCLLPVYFCAGVLQALGELSMNLQPVPAGDVAATLARSQAMLPQVKGIQFLMAPFVIGLMAGASVAATRELGRVDLKI